MNNISCWSILILFETGLSLCLSIILLLLEIFLITSIFFEEFIPYQWCCCILYKFYTTHQILLFGRFMFARRTGTARWWVRKRTSLQSTHLQSTARRSGTRTCTGNRSPCIPCRWRLNSYAYVSLSLPSSSHLPMRLLHAELTSTSNIVCSSLSPLQLMGESPCPRWKEIFQEVQRTNESLVQFINKTQVCATAALFLLLQLYNYISRTVTIQCTRIVL